MNSKKSITSESIVVRNQEIVHSDMGDETVMMSIDNGEYYGVNPVGSRVWKLVESPVTVSELCRILLDEYEVEPAQCRQDILSFLTELLQKNLISIQG